MKISKILTLFVVIAIELSGCNYKSENPVSKSPKVNQPESSLDGIYTALFLDGDFFKGGSISTLNLQHTFDKQEYKWELSDVGHMVGYTISGYGLMNDKNEMELYAEKVLDGNFMGKSGELTFDKPLLKVVQNGKDLTIIDFDRRFFDFDDNKFKREK